MLSNRIRKTSVALAVIASVVGTGVMSVGAQDTTATPTTPTTSDSTQAQSARGPGRGFGRGMVMGVGLDGNLADSPIIAAIADALKLDVDTLVADLQSGQSITDLATAQSVDIQTVYDAVSAKYKQLLDAEVSTGYLTQAQADTQLQNFTDNIAQFPFFATMQFPDPANTQGRGFPGGRGGFPGGPNGNGPHGGFPGGPWGGFGGPWGHQRNNGDMNGNGPQGGFGGNGPQGAPNTNAAPQDSQATPEASASASA